MGIDIGLYFFKSRNFENGEDVLAKEVVSLGAGTTGAKQVIDLVLDKTGVKREEIAYIVATGYGRNSFKDADKTMSELSCHAKGGVYLFGDIGTIVDIGGQDIGRAGHSRRHVTKLPNERQCAAGTGRFLEVMANVLDVSIDDLGGLDAQATESFYQLDLYGLRRIGSYFGLWQRIFRSRTSCAVFTLPSLLKSQVLRGASA